MTDETPDLPPHMQLAKEALLPPNAPTESTAGNTDGSAPDTRAILTALRDEDYPQPATEYPSELTTADKWYAGFSGFVIGVCIALAVITAAYILYNLAFPEGSAHDLIDTE